MPEAILDSLGLPAFLRVVVKKYQPPLATRGKSEKTAPREHPSQAGSWRQTDFSSGRRAYHVRT